MQQRWLWRLVPLACSLIAFLWPLYFLHRTPGADWQYFDSLALVVRSCVHTYGRFPMHEPWVLGGADLLANPQTRIFSPLGLFDQIFRPHVANVLSLVVHGVFGAWGMSRVLARLGHNRVVASLGALMFICGSWFMLHFCEGHIPYGVMQLLPWTVLWLLELDQPAAWVKLAALLAFFLLDGGMYAFIYTFYAAIVMALVGLLPLGGFVASVRAHPAVLPVTCVAFIGVMAPKMIPVLDSLGDRPKHIESATMTARLIGRALYDPDQWFLKGAPPTMWRFHEVGCYLGFAASLLILMALVRPAFLKAQWRWLVFAFVFFWIGTNLLAPANPWELIIRTPFLRNAHVQSRNFIWMYFAWVILVCAAVRSFRFRPLITQGLLLAAVLEIVVVSQRQWFRTMHNDGGEQRYNATAHDITARQWKYTVMWGTKPEHYFLDGVGSLDTYEPGQRDRTIRYRGGPGYFGEIRVTGGVGSAQLKEVSPGFISFHYEGTTPARVRINQNRLAGWEITEGQGELPEDDYSIDVQLAQAGDFVLRYAPWYWPDVLWAYLLGIVVFFGLAHRLRHKSTA